MLFYFSSVKINIHEVDDSQMDNKAARPLSAREQSGQATRISSIKIKIPHRSTRDFSKF